MTLKRQSKPQSAGADEFPRDYVEKSSQVHQITAEDVKPAFSVTFMENHSTIKSQRANPAAGDTKQGYRLLQKDALQQCFISFNSTLDKSNDVKLNSWVMQRDNVTTNQTHQPTNPEGHSMD